MSSAYRGRTRTCPGCSDPMRELRVPVAGEIVVVDRCDRCAGTFVEFFDGEPSSIARALAASVGAGAATALDAHACPDCGEAMPPARYLSDGPELRRCGGCMAFFASADALRELSRYEQQSTATPERSWLQRVLAALGAD